MIEPDAKLGCGVAGRDVLGEQRERVIGIEGVGIGAGQRLDGDLLAGW